MRSFLEKAGSMGAVVAAAACPVCFPKLALVGALFGLGAFSAYEAQLFLAAQVLIVIAMAGHALSYLRHRNAWLLAGALASGAAVFAGLYWAGSETLAYAGLGGLVAASAVEFWHRRRRNPLESVITCPSCGARSKETMPTTPASSSTTAEAAVPSCVQRPAIAASSARTARFDARPCSRLAQHDDR